MPNENEFPTRLLFAGFVHDVVTGDHGIDLIGYKHLISGHRIGGSRPSNSSPDWTRKEEQLAVMVLADEGVHHIDVTHTGHPTWITETDFTIDMPEHTYCYTQIFKGEFPLAFGGDEAFLNAFQIRLDGASIGQAYVLGNLM